MYSLSSLDWFREKLSSSSRQVLFLDYDGTLAPFTEDRESAFPYPAVIPLLDEIRASESTRMVVVSGRPVEDVENLLNMRETPEIWGSHGMERMTADGRFTKKEIGAAALAALDDAYGLAVELNCVQNVETKVASGIALHWRGEDEKRTEFLKSALGDKWKTVAAGTGLELHEFDGGLELRPEGVNKGRAVDTVLDEEPQGIPAAYLGDDATDEDAFEALGKRGLSILVKSVFRETKADAWIKPPDELIGFLKLWLESVNAQSR